MLLLLAACAPDPCEHDSDAESRATCCVAEYGRGVVEKDDLASLAESCAGEGCDPEQYVSAEAAVCIAARAGLEGAAERTWTELALREDGDAEWIVTVLEEPGECGSAGFLDIEGDALVVDARDGITGASAQVWVTAECEP